jgi:hypothetical protein
MAQHSSIEWTESTWNPVTGCTKVSPGCKYCYAERMAQRIQLMGQANYRQGVAVTLQEQMLELRGPGRGLGPRSPAVGRGARSDLSGPEGPGRPDRIRRHRCLPFPLRGNSEIHLLGASGTATIRDMTAERLSISLRKTGKRLHAIFKPGLWPRKVQSLPAPSCII